MAKSKSKDEQAKEAAAAEQVEEQAPVEETAPVEPEQAPEPEVQEPVQEAPAAPAKGDGLIACRIVRTPFHDGQRFRARGEIVHLDERQLRNVGDAVQVVD